MKTITDNQRVAIHTAIMLLEQSKSDHAEQACFYLKQLVEQSTNES